MAVLRSDYDSSEIDERLRISSAFVARCACMLFFLFPFFFFYLGFANYLVIYLFIGRNVAISGIGNCVELNLANLIWKTSSLPNANKPNFHYKEILPYLKVGNVRVVVGSDGSDGAERGQQKYFRHFSGVFIDKT